MKNKNQILGIKRVVRRNKIIRTIGLDSNVAIALIEDSEDYSIYKPRLLKRENAVWINHIVFAEIMGF